MNEIELECTRNKIEVAAVLFGTVQEAMCYGGQSLDNYALALMGACEFLEQIINKWEGMI